MKDIVENIDRYNQLLDKMEPMEILKWVNENLQGQVAMTTSLQISGMVILDMLSKLDVEFPVYFIDTGYHFTETLDFKTKVEKYYNFKVTSVKPQMSRQRFEQIYGKALHDSDPDFCCKKNKIEPQQQIMAETGYQYWLSGIRRDQSHSRADYKVLMLDENGYIRVHPLINWKWNQVWDYINQNQVPYHPLYLFGYTPIGCSPESCTVPANGGSGERSGRWRNKAKTECGLHQKLSVSVNLAEFVKNR